MSAWLWLDVLERTHPSDSSSGWHYIGAVLDRNGLRPARYYRTYDDRVIMASEVGVLPVPPETVAHKGRLKPGRMFLIDFEQGRMIPDVELKNDIASHRPYGDWLNAQRLKLTELPVQGDAHGFDSGCSGRSQK